MGLNTNEWLKDKKGQYFQDWKERVEIIRHLDMVDAVITVPYDEKGSAVVQSILADIAETVVFGNGGDRGKDNTPEVEKFKDNPRVEFLYGVSGTDKMNSSSWYICMTISIDNEKF